MKKKTGGERQEENKGKDNITEKKRDAMVLSC